MIRRIVHCTLAAAIFSIGFSFANSAIAQLVVPVPAQNPITEPKRVLGKILFWDEQLSTDNTTACGTCHFPSAAGADARNPQLMRHPGADGVLGNNNDVAGSAGVVHLDSSGNFINDPVFGLAPQVTGRAAQSYFASMWASDNFWDGRARSAFVDPLNPSVVVIPSGGGLESQAVGPILSSVEMAKTGRQWSEVTAKLQLSSPMALASDLPPDVASAVQANPTYTALFAAAFGDGAITPVRIAFAIATYERTLVPDQTPFDLGTMTANQQAGFAEFQNEQCDSCHTPPLFTDNNFFNIGLRAANEDIGRQQVTGSLEDAGEMKTASLRNVGLRRTFMHSGEFTTIGQVIGHYNNPAVANDRDNIPGGGNYNFAVGNQAQVTDFLANALTDPRVAAESFPFDRPTLRSEAPADTQAPNSPASFTGNGTSGTTIDLTWNPATDNVGVVDYRLSRDNVVVAWLTGTSFQDSGLVAGATHGYTIVARDAALNESLAVTIQVSTVGQTTTVPAVIGQSQANATTAIVAANLVVGTITSANSNTVPTGSVISQTPAAGSSVAEGSTVDLTVSLGAVQVTVPSVVGQSQANATTAIVAANLVVGTVTTANSNTVPAGNVISQTPAAGNSVATGSAVNLTVSAGAAQVTVPSVVGRTQANAQSTITAAGLVVGAVTQASSATVAAGRVISQAPPGANSVALGTAVNLTISTGAGAVPATVPSVVGLSRANAEAAVVAAGLVVGTVATASSSTVPSGQVIDQSPAGGSSASAGSAVSLTVSTGLAVVTVPAVVGMSQAAATAAIEAAGLVAGSVTSVETDAVAAGQVNQQVPVGGSTLTPGSRVDLVIAEEPDGGGGSTDLWMLLGLASLALTRRRRTQDPAARSNL